MAADPFASHLPDLVDTAWLAAALPRSDVKVIDARWFMPGVEPTGAQAHRESHIPGAVFFDIDGVADRSTTLPHMLPGTDAFEQAMGAMGIRETDTVVVYDGDSLLGAPRVWWTLRRFGHRRVAVLDGGLRQWREEGRPVRDGHGAVTPVRYVASPDDALVTTLRDLRSALAGGAVQVVDARSRGRFEGREPEPRPGLRSGHIPGSRNLPYTQVLDAATGRLLPPDALHAVFAHAGVDPRAPTIASCGSGVTACVLALAFARAGHRTVSVYDGAWAEWGGTPGLPVAVLQG